MNINETFENQREYFLSGQTLELDKRKQVLGKLIDVFKSNEDKLYAAIEKDLGKSSFETYEAELSMLYHDAKTFIKNISKWSKPQRVMTNLSNIPATSKIVPEPLGTSLIIGAWNYPYQLTLVPLVAAIGAGNTAILKPSELSPNTSAVMAELINNNFDPKLIRVIEGGIEESTELLKLPFDKFFYTGSSQVGKIVMHAAAEHLSSVTLELGGKSPCFVFADAKLKIAARRIAWGKFLNSGQTCVAPDYLYVEESVKEQFLQLLIAEIKSIYGSAPEKSEGLVNIINRRHFDRVTKMIDPDKVYYGGKSIEEQNFIEPTIMHNVTYEDEVMQTEIFGPIFPVMTFTDRNKVFAEVRRQPKPLAAYIFTSSKDNQNYFIDTMPFGSASINDTVVQVTNNKLPFGGIGNSGVGGGYHGIHGFKCFSHYKSVVNRNTLMELPFKYPPFNKFKLSVLKNTLE